MPGGYNALMAYPPRDKEDSSFSFFDSEVVPGTRGNIFPAAQYDDGKYHLAWPGLVAQPIEGFNALWERGDEANITNPDALAQSSRESFDAAGLAATGGLAAGIAGVGERGIAKHAADSFDVDQFSPIDHLDYVRDVIMKLPHGEQPGVKHGEPFNSRLYHGSWRQRSPEETAKHGEMWASSSPAEAATYAYINRPNAQAHMMPVDVRLQNPLVVDAKGANWNRIPMSVKGGGETSLSTDDITRSAKKYYPDHDGLVFQNVFENGDQPSTSVVALKPGTVYSPLTGAQIYSSPYGLGQKFRNMLTGGSDAGAVPEGAVAANGWGSKLKGLFGRSEPEPSPYDFGERQGPPMRYGTGEYQLEQRLEPPAFDGINSRDFSILKDGEPIGKAKTVINGPSAFVDVMSVDGGSNALGLRGIRDLREAYRQAAPEVTNFRGERVFDMKTTDTKPRGGGRSQSVDLYSNSPNAASVPLAINDSASPLAFTDTQDQQNALMPSSLSKKEKDHHSLNQNRTASGQFTR